MLAACCISLPSYAQRGGKAGGKGKGKKPAVHHTVKRKVKRQVAQGHTYHPVFGYTSPVLSKDFATVHPVTSADIHSVDFFGKNGRLIQTAPILNPVTSPLMYLQAFTHTKDISTPQLAEGFYLYRIAQPEDVVFPVRRPDDIMLTEGYTSSFLNESRRRLEQFSPSILTEELPSLRFLEYLQDPYMPVKSYAEIAKFYRESYPKHITLNEEGIPVKTEKSKAARILDNYLMLSNRDQLGAFNNTQQGANYTPFILTPEEHAAADELLAARLAGEAIPNNPTPRDLIEIAYNRLESHTVPYTQAEKAGIGYKAYPNYKNTALYRSIQGMIKGQKPVTSDHNGIRVLENEDITHLIVLDAIMGGVELADLKHADRALRAFDEFSAELENTPENMKHVYLLQQNLRIVFEPYIEYNRKMSPYSIDGEDALGWKAHELLERVSAGNLVGRNWRQHGRQFID